MRSRFSDVLKKHEPARSIGIRSESSLGRYLDTPPNPFGKRLRAVFKTIDSVHVVGGLPPIPVLESNSRDTPGEYLKHGGTGKPIAIEISTKGPRPELTLTHEIGHFIEQAGLPGHNLGSRSWAFDPHMGEFLASVHHSRAVASLQNVHQSDGDDVFRRYIAYLLRPEELWARCYAQYIATQSENPTLLGQLEIKRSPDPPTPIQSQWQDDDFVPIARAIDALFRSIGWRP